MEDTRAENATTTGTRRLRLPIPRTLGGRVTPGLVAAGVLAVVLTTAVMELLGRHVLGPVTAIAMVFAALAGVVAGAVISYTMTRRIRLAVGRIRTEGHRAIDGEPWQHLSALAPDSATEFAELDGVVDEVLDALSEREAELSAATQAARRAEDSLKVAVDASFEAKLMLENGVVTLANPAAVSCLGMQPSQLLGRTLAEGLSATTVTSEDGTTLEWEQLVHAAAGVPQVVRISRPDLIDRWLKVAAVDHPAGHFDRVLVTARDITEERRLASLRDELVSLISHDLRAPLTVITGYLDILRRQLDDVARDRALDQAKANAERMSALIDDLLGATKADELLAPTSLRPVALASLAEDAAASLDPSVTHHPIEVVVADRPVVLGEEKRLRQALMNLLTNAFKYSDDGTPVTLRVSAGGGLARVAVEDRGPGVPRQARGTIFGRYARLEGNGSNPPGLGLGLYIVRIIAESHGGGARVEEAEGGGARFVIELPAAEAADDG